MYSSKITLFNYYESATTGDVYWYPHVLSGVDLITDKGAILKKYGPDATDNAQLHVRYTVQNGDATITDRIRSDNHHQIPFRQSTHPPRRTIRLRM